MTDWVEKHPGVPDAAWNKEVMNVSLPLSRGVTFATTLPAESNARYSGKGIKHGDATTPVFWYKVAGASNYRVIYGDLSIKEQKAAPESPKGVPLNSGNSRTELLREIMKRKPAPPLAPEPLRVPAPPAPPAPPAKAPVATPKI